MSCIEIKITLTVRLIRCGKKDITSGRFSQPITQQKRILEEISKHGRYTYIYMYMEMKKEYHPF
jgi:hypothetical protein